MIEAETDGIESERAEVTHRCPPKGSGLMPCCGRTPFEVSPCDRMTLDPNFVTCGKPRAAMSTNGEGTNDGR